MSDFYFTDDNPARDVAYNTALGWLQMAFEGRTADLSDLEGDELTAALREIAELHNRLLDESGMDGFLLELDEED